MHVQTTTMFIWRTWLASSLPTVFLHCFILIGLMTISFFTPSCHCCVRRNWDLRTKSSNQRKFDLCSHSSDGSHGCFYLFSQLHVLTWVSTLDLRAFCCFMSWRWRVKKQLAAVRTHTYSTYKCRLVAYPESWERPRLRSKLLWHGPTCRPLNKDSSHVVMCWIKLVLEVSSKWTFSLLYRSILVYCYYYYHCRLLSNIHWCHRSHRSHWSHRSHLRDSHHWILILNRKDKHEILSVTPMHEPV